MHPHNQVLQTDRELRIKSAPHPIEETLGVVVDRADQPVQHKLLLLSLELGHLDLHGIANNVPKDPSTHASVGGQPLQRSPP